MGDDNNSISREIAIAILSQYVTVEAYGPKDTYALKSATDCVVVKLFPEVKKRTLEDLTRKYSIPMHHWYNPHLTMKGGLLTDTDEKTIQ